ncbi:MAG: hypothetical protein CMP49_01305 [Flavobacteriales bacterium]|jgi:uncharacterized membrane protein YqgA involved in biofilm formation|nr:hypothetical protein [Flavobacteriales bacterium]|tara:strand:- start:99 stop:794 length:696 start_codon:yes stop_codon:yes gene_type:complete
MILAGTLINILAVVVGSLVGLIFKKIIKPEINKKVFYIIGLFTLVLGLSIAIQTNSFILILTSLIVGTIIGEYYEMDDKINTSLIALKNKFKIKDKNFTDGFLTAFLLFCVGSMTIVGAIDEGLGKSPEILYTKAIMDGFSSILLASTFGIGVLFSIFPMFFFQGGLTFLAFLYKDFIPLTLIEHISALGGVLIVAIALKILGYKKINPTNMLPSLLIIVIFYLMQNIISC